MTEILLFHHAHGLTDGVLGFAETLKLAGHRVHTPDLFEGRVFTSLDDGLAYASETGFGVIRERGVRAADDLPNELVYAGFSLGAMPAQQLAQTRDGARGLLLFHAAISPSEFGTWPGLPAQVHTMEADPFFEEGDLAAARELEKAGAELFFYPGDQHLFSDATLPAYDQEASALLTARALELLAQVDRA
ncbi:dienelactone hydrolase family protein [Nocardioides jensenii]|uniref:dienelactone hydrolase family protein n=1 Tax=Nocardioides jensenii TaxID=1843 RepID=UPI00082E551F|nr:dienelactone hydrolase family protein [Nocardioides jensenii]